MTKTVIASRPTKHLWLVDLCRKLTRAERIVLVVSFGFVVGVFTYVWFSDAMTSSTSSGVALFGGGVARSSGNMASDCQDPKNKRTPYCQQHEGKNQSTWKALVRGGEQPPIVFSLRSDTD